ERELYGWVNEEVFTQSSVITFEHLPELRREMRLTQDLASERECYLLVWVSGSLFRIFKGRFRRGAEWRLLHAPPPRNAFLSFRAYQGRRLFDAFEESIQKFKWHYFKILPLPGSRPFWLDDEGKLFPWVYWNPLARECQITTLDPLETLAFQFLQSLTVGLGKKSNFKCRWILDHSDAEVGVFLGIIAYAEIWRNKAAKTAFCRRWRSPAVPAPAPATFVPLAPSSSASKAGKPSDATAAKPFSVEREEGAREDPVADLRQKRRERKVSEASTEEAALGGDSAWKHKVNPIDRAFPPDYNFRAALDAGLNSGPIREILGPLVPGQLLGTAPFLACQLTACLQVGVENTFVANVQLEKDLAATKDQVAELERAEGERLSALDRMKEVEERAKVQATELESCRSALAQERKKDESLTQSFKGKQMALDEAEAAAVHWRGEWKSLEKETGEMVQETFEILMDQVHHLNPAIDYSMITLDTRWDPKGKGFIILRLRSRSSRSLWWWTAGARGRRAAESPARAASGAGHGGRRWGMPHLKL
ncbi:hypothetical protein PIB30_076382, partial [Stylosanthes scabra]|nr:hypothetical protein [Stylosanthes scabra]